jgi:dual specificity tyrosine-phosphorylation-regulated kinase 2/3/4
VTEKLPETEPALPKESPRRTLEKRLTAFEREEAKQYELYFVGARRVGSLVEFTDAEGDARVAVGDAIAYKYEIVGVLGRGSFGKVFKAWDHKKKEHIALKIIKNQEKFTVQARV